MLLQKSKKTSERGGNRLLVTVTVLGSAGPMRFLVNEKELVTAVINTTLRSYAREGRLPVLGSDLNDFLLYSSNAGSDALSPLEAIGLSGGRNFVLCKKQVVKSPSGNVITMRSEGRAEAMESRRRRTGSSSWKAWINKSLSFKISSH